MMAIIIVLNYVFFSSIFQRRLKLYLSFDFLAYPFVFCTIWKDLKVDYMHNACVLKYTHWLKLHKLPPSMKLGCFILKNMQKFWVYFIRVICNLIIVICTYSEFTQNLPGRIIEAFLPCYPKNWVLLWKFVVSHASNFHTKKIDLLTTKIHNIMLPTKFWTFVACVGLGRKQINAWADKVVQERPPYPSSTWTTTTTVCSKAWLLPSISSLYVFQAMQLLEELVILGPFLKC